MAALSVLLTGQATAVPLSDRGLQHKMVCTMYFTGDLLFAFSCEELQPVEFQIADFNLKAQQREVFRLDPEGCLPEEGTHSTGWGAGGDPSIGLPERTPLRRGWQS